MKVKQKRREKEQMNSILLEDQKLGRKKEEKLEKVIAEEKSNKKTTPSFKLAPKYRDYHLHKKEFRN